MSTPPEAVLALEPNHDGMHRLAAFIDEFAESHELSAKDAYAIHIAAEELFANTLAHSDPPARAVEFRLEVAEDVATGVYTDDGAEHDTTSPDVPDTELAPEERRIGGLGIHLIRTMMRDFTYERVGNQNRTVFRRILARG